MKNTLIILLLFIISVSLFSDEPTLQEKMELAKKDWENINIELYISPGVIADVGIGLTQCLKLKKFYHEGTFILHADLIPHVFEKDIEEFYKIYFWGIKYKSAYFYKEDCSGFNWFFNVGFQSIFIDLSFGGPGGSSGSSNPSWHGFPDLAVGCGYSWKLKNSHYFRISLDAGVKLVISNLYFSYVW